MYSYKLDKNYDDKDQKGYKNRIITSFHFCLREQNHEAKLMLLNTIVLLEEK